MVCFDAYWEEVKEIFGIRIGLIISFWLITTAGGIMGWMGWYVLMPIGKK